MSVSRIPLVDASLRFIKHLLTKLYIRQTLRSIFVLTVCAALLISTIVLPPPKAAAAIAQRGTATSANGDSNTKNLIISKPTGVVSGDVMVAGISVGGSTNSLFSVPSGWTQVDNNAYQGYLITYYRIAGAGEPASWTWTENNASNSFSGGIIAYSGVDNGNPIDNFGASHSTNAGTGFTASTTAFTTTSDNAMVIAFYSQVSTCATQFGTPAGMTNRFYAPANGSYCTAGDDKLQATAGSTGSFSASSGGNLWGASMIALAPPPIINQSAYRFLSNLDAADPTKLQSNPSAGIDTINGIATDTANGFFYVAGNTATAWVVQKFNMNDGAKLSAFTYASPASGTVGGIAIDPGGGAIFVVGQVGTNWQIEKRRVSDGALCTAANCGTQFGVNGVLAPGIAGGANSIDIDTTNGFIYVGGYDTAGADEWRSAKYTTSTGAVDAAFTQGACAAPASGYVCTNPSAGSDRIQATSYDSLGYIYTGGYDTVSGNNAWRLEKRRTSDGLLCTAANCGTQFATGGVYTNNITANPDQILTLQADSAGNAVYAGGFDGANANQWHLEKLKGDSGALCTAAAACNGGAFNTTGIVTFDGLATGSDQLTSLDVDSPSGYLYTSGQNASLGATNFQWRIEKRNTGNGQLVGAFGTSGVVNVNPSANNDAPAYVAVNTARNLLYTAGGDASISTADTQWRMQKFALDTGTLWLDTPQDTAAIASNNITYRLRLVLGISNGSLNVNGRTLKLQYALRSGTCDTGFVGETYNDVTGATSGIQYHSNPTVANGAAAVSLSGQPTDGANPLVLQTIGESNNFTSNLNVGTGKDGVWDFSLQDSSAFGAYCFRVIYSDGTLLNGPTRNGTYVVIPEISFCLNPATDAALRGGTYFCSGAKRAFFWAP